MRSIIDAISDMPPPPCDKYICNNRDYCKLNNACCVAFVRYCADGRIKIKRENSETLHSLMENPTPKLFKRLMDEKSPA